MFTPAATRLSLMFSLFRSTQMAAADLYYNDTKKKDSKKAAGTGSVEEEDEDEEESGGGGTVIKRKSAARSGSPTVCVEDQDHLASTEDCLLVYTCPVKESVASVSWVHAYDTDRKGIRILPPLSVIDYSTRIRTRHLTFTVTATLQGGVLTADSGGNSFSASKPPESLTALLFDCESPECEHVILPLRIRQMRSSLVGASPTVPVRVQLWTHEFKYSASDKKRYKPWLPENSSETKTHYGDAKAPTVVDTAYSLSLSSGASNDYSACPRLLYEAPKSQVTPALMDLQWLLGSDSVEFMKSVRKSSGEEKAVAYLSQPDPKTNRAPNWLSYFVTTQQLLNAPRGSTPYKRVAFTHIEAGTKEPLFKFTPEFYKHAITRIQESQSDKRYAMNIAGGMWATFQPTDIKAWNAHLLTQIDKGITETVFMSVEFVVDYVVLGPVR